MTNALLMDMVYVGCGVIFGLIVRKFIVTYCKRPWVGLTEDEALALGKQYYNSPVSLMYAVEAKLKEKNNG